MPGRGNFTGKTVDGYDAAECVLVRQAAEALKAVQADVKAKGLTLKVYDCYRPARAVAAFVAWAKQPDDPKAKADLLSQSAQGRAVPRLYRHALRPFARRHARPHAGAVDAAAPPSRRDAKPRACTAPQKGHAPDGSVAMGTSFDCFDVKANTAALGLSKEERANRELLVEAMQARGFKNYPMEWWHFTLAARALPRHDFRFSDRAAARRLTIRRGRRARAARGAPAPRRSRWRSAARRAVSG